MRKAESLKKLLLETVPGLRDNPERLALFIDNGTVAGGHGPSLSFEYRYVVNLVFEGFTGSTNHLVVPILAWIADNQPELLGRPGVEPFSFEAEILDQDSQDVSIRVALTEPAVVTPREDGGYAVSHPNPGNPRDLDLLPGNAKLWQLFLRDTLIAQTSDPEFQP
ncbi:P2 phage tail completion protein R (GpR) [Sphingomonas laterariae]|uniref:P2 phage tail completion protein R (GpR) n=1 Tax=Edaphosphingomonas laterariae TaxID=861865 RepID=A0A239CJB3_9SPHN|nr:phage tail protein [Sphingomonas laterariae]SNS20267.1 P2 phage tail completion protein R (GpR) [Sphingomonas laterariae]